MKTTTTTTPAAPKPRRLTLRQVKTVDVNALEWRDKVNGNSYFAATVTLNFGMANAETLTLPFQYGYGSQNEWEAFAEIKRRFGLAEDRKQSLWSWCQDRGIILRTSKQENCKQRELKALTA